MVSSCRFVINQFSRGHQHRHALPLIISSLENPREREMDGSGMAGIESYLFLQCSLQPQSLLDSMGGAVRSGAPSEPIALPRLVYFDRSHFCAEAAGDAIIAKRAGRESHSTPTTRRGAEEAAVAAAVQVRGAQD